MIPLIFLILLVVALGTVVLLFAWLRNRQATVELITRASNSIWIRLAVVGGIVLVAQIPLISVQDILFERQNYANEVTTQLAQDAGGKQTFAGPFLVVPYLYETEEQVPVFTAEGTRARDDAGRLLWETSVKQTAAEALFLPQSLELQAALEPQTLKRSIYHTTSYRAQIASRASFAALDFSDVAPTFIEIDRTAPAYLAFTTSNLTAVEGSATANLNGKALSGFTRGSDLFEGGATLAIELPDDAQAAPMNVDLALALTGHDGFDVVPIANANSIEMQSSWPHPSFRGPTPSEREISPEGFSATWKPSSLAQSFTAANTPTKAVIERGQRPLIGVSLFERFGTYSLVDRAIKYALLIIGLTLATIFAIDQSARHRMHPIQYLVVGGGLGLFYLLLLSLSEIVGFPLAFLGAATALTLSIGGYVAASLRSLARGALIAGGLAGLYALLYTLLNLRDFALLAGSGVLFIALLITMVLTSRMNAKASTKSLADGVKNAVEVSAS